MGQYMLERTGGWPLGFQGDLLASGHTPDRQERWHTVHVYYAPAGLWPAPHGGRPQRGARYIVEIWRYSRIQGEYGWSDVSINETLADVLDTLRSYTPVNPIEWENLVENISQQLQLK